MTDQLRISDDGSIESQPLTWDGEPMYSPATVQEGLFDRSAFEQIRGQLAWQPECGRAWCIAAGCCGCVSDEPEGRMHHGR